MAAARAERRHRFSRAARGAVAPALLALAGASACSDDASNGAHGTGGTAVASAGNGGSQQASSGAGGSAGSSSAGTGGSSSGGSSSGGSGSGGSTASGYAAMGVCGRRGESPVSADSFEGYEEYYLIGGRGFGSDICVVRFKVSRVGEAPPGCEDCAWSHRVAYSDPEVLKDENDVCANSQLGMTAAKIAELDGSEASYGFVYEYAGHVSVLLKYDEASSTWGPNGNASWTEETGLLSFDQRNGFCGY